MNLLVYEWNLDPHTHKGPFGSEDTLELLKDPWGSPDPTLGTNSLTWHCHGHCDGSLLFHGYCSGVKRKCCLIMLDWLSAWTNPCGYHPRRYNKTTTCKQCQK